MCTREKRHVGYATILYGTNWITLEGLKRISLEQTCSAYPTTSCPRLPSTESWTDWQIDTLRREKMQRDLPPKAKNIVSKPGTCLTGQESVQIQNARVLHIETAGGGTQKIGRFHCKEPRRVTQDSSPRDAATRVPLTAGMQCRCTGVGRRKPMALQAVSSQSHSPSDSKVASSSDTAPSAAISAFPLPSAAGWRESPAERLGSTLWELSEKSLPPRLVVASWAPPGTALSPALCVRR